MNWGPCSKEQVRVCMPPRPMSGLLTRKGDRGAEGRRLGGTSLAHMLAISLGTRGRIGGQRAGGRSGLEARWALASALWRGREAVCKAGPVRQLHACPGTNVAVTRVNTLL